MRRVLLWKDLLLLKDTLLASLALMAFSYIVAAILVYTGDAGEFSLANIVAGGASLVRFTSLLTCALIGGHIHGREREEGSIEFLRLLPVAQAEILRSKLSVAAASVAVIWMISLALLVLGLSAMGFDPATSFRVLYAMLGFVACGLAVLGAAWLASHIVSSAIGASFAGLLVLAPILAAQSAANWAYPAEGRPFFHWTTMLAATTFGGSCIAVCFRLAANASRAAAPRSASAAQIEANGPNRIYSQHHEKSTSGINRREAPHSLGRLPRHPLLAVMWKDFKLAKTPLVTGLLVLAAPYLVVIAGAGLLDDMPVFFRGASLIGIGIGCIVFAFWSGHIVTTEQLAKTNTFSSYLPIPPAYRVLSKLLVTFCPAVLVVTANLASLLLADNAARSGAAFGPSFTWADWNANGFVVMGLALTNGSLLAYAASWLIGMRTRRAVSSIAAGVIAVPVCVMVFASVSSSLSIAEDAVPPLRFALLFGAGTVGSTAACLLAGARLEARDLPL